jgi:2-polyprenyl-3-methyl-5-hydroxy-6-metoxy-1,4-benzoquinol methylase
MSLSAKAEALLAHIFQRNSLQQKRIEAFHAATPAAREGLEHFVSLYSPYLQTAGLDWKTVGDAYLTMVGQVGEARLHFMRTGNYPARDQIEAREQVYDRPEVMRPYMLGLALSQYLWAHHFACKNFFEERIVAMSRPQRILEVGSGHGWFTYRMLELCKPSERFTVLDISPTSLDLTRGLLKALCPAEVGEIEFIEADLMRHERSEHYDFIVLSEVLEHVDDPEGTLRHLHKQLAPGGFLYLNTCANCPAIDHAFHFRSCREISSLVRECGYEVVTEAYLPSENLPPEVLEQRQLDVSYVALLQKEPS